MLLRDQMIRSGHWLFRWRGFLPLVMVPFLLAGIAVQGPLEARGVVLVGVRAWWWLGIALVIAGLAGRFLTVGFVREGTSGRNTAEGQVATELNTTGIYACVRNPLYFFNCTIYIGTAFFAGFPLLVPVFALALALYYERIIAAEEDFLSQRFGADYTGWAERTPAFWPRFGAWTQPARGYSMSMALVREHTTILLAVLTLYLLRLAFAHIAPEPLPVPAGWHWAMGLALAGWVLVRLGRKAGVLRRTEG